MSLNKKEIIKAVAGMLRLSDDKEYLCEVLTEEEWKMTSTQLKAHLRNIEIKNNNNRVDELLTVNEIDE